MDLLGVTDSSNNTNGLGILYFLFLAFLGVKFDIVVNSRRGVGKSKHGLGSCRDHRSLLTHLEWAGFGLAQEFSWAGLRIDESLLLMCDFFVCISKFSNLIFFLYFQIKFINFILLNSL